MKPSNVRIIGRAGWLSPFPTHILVEINGKDEAIPSIEYIAKQKCALLGCELDYYDEPLGKLKKSKSPEVSRQASLLISKYGFKDSDILCIDCFWK